MSKRKVREGDEGDEDNKLKRVPVKKDQASLFTIPGLRFATESWAGMKTTNEDRHVSSTEYFPGPVFAIFDGHGGTFTADFLVRQLVKTLASSIRQNIGEKTLENLLSSQEFSRQENDRRRAILEQLGSLNQQLEELNAMREESSDHGTETGVVKELGALQDQLKAAIAEMQQEVKQIDAEEGDRCRERQQWHRKQQTHIVYALKDGFEAVDTQVLKKNPSRDGSTALLVWFASGDAKNETNTARLDDEQQMSKLSFYTANVGDCRAVMCRGGQSVPLTSDHKPDRTDERQRIEKAGGFVGKIAGISRVYSAAGAGLAVDKETSTYLAVSRAFGDRSLKTPTKLVSCEPEVKRYQVEDDDLFLVLACDGIWDVLTDQEAVDIALLHFRDAKAAVDAVVKAAYKKGSIDNLTATVIQFGWKSDAQVQQAAAAKQANLSWNVANDGAGRGADADDAKEEEEEIDMFNI